MVYLTIDQSTEHALPYYFASAEAALNWLPISEITEHHTVYLVFERTVHFEDLITLLNTLDRCEVVLFLQGNPSFNDQERMEIYQQALYLANERHGNLHIFLLNSPANKKLRQFQMQSLSLEDNIEGEPFTLLREDRGYYLSAQDFFSKIFRNKQHAYLEIADGRQDSPREYNSRRLQQSENPLDIYRTEKAGPSEVRALKQANKQQLKDRIKYRVSSQVAAQHAHHQAQEMSQNQSHSQQQAVSQTQALRQNLDNGQSWPFSHDATCAEFVKILQEEGLRVSTKESDESYHLLCKGYLAHNRSDLFTALAYNHHLRLQIASNIYGEKIREIRSLFFHSSPATISILSKKSVDVILSNPSYFLDQFYILHEDNYRSHVTFGQRIIDEISPPPDGVYRSEYRHHNVSNFNYRRAMPLLSALPEGFERHVRPYALLDDDCLNELDDVAKITINAIAERLMSLFLMDDIPTQDAQAEIKYNFLALIQFYFPEKKDEYCALIEKLCNYFIGVHFDQYKMLIHVPIVGGKRLLEKALEMLTMLDEKCLLSHFYYIVFYAQYDILSITDLLVPPPFYEHEKANARCLKNTFLELARITPNGHPTEWPAFYRFYHLYLLFLAAHHIDTNEGIETFENHWNNTKAKFLNYTHQNEEKTEKLLELMSSQFTFALLIQNYSADVLARFDCIIDAAIKNNTLEEQLENFAGLSLTEVDAPYAIKCNGFKVVSQEMRVRLSTLDNNTRTYAVSLSELENYLSKATVDDCYHQELEYSLFRYLGCESAREPYQYYQLMFTKFNHSKEEVLLFGWMIARTTGPYYDPFHRMKQDAELIELITDFESIQLSSKDMTAALAFFCKKLPACYDFRSISLLLRLVKDTLHSFKPARFLPLITKIQQWHERYDSQFTGLLLLLNQRHNGTAIFTDLIANPKKIEELLAMHEDALAMQHQRIQNTEIEHSINLRHLLMEHPESSTLFLNCLENSPPILLRPFVTDSVSSFIQLNKTEIEAAIKEVEKTYYKQSHNAFVRVVNSHRKTTQASRESWINDVTTLLCHQLLYMKIATSLAKQEALMPLQNALFDVLKAFYPALTIAALAKELQAIDRLIANLIKLAKLVDERQPGSLNFMILHHVKTLFEKTQSHDVAFALIEIILNSIYTNANDEPILRIERWLDALSMHDQLLSTNFTRLMPLMSYLTETVLLNTCLHTNLAGVLRITETLLVGGSVLDITVLNKVTAILQMIASRQDATLIRDCEALDTPHLLFFIEQILTLHDENVAVAYLQLIAQGNNQTYFSPIEESITNMDEEKKIPIISICLNTCQERLDIWPRLAHQLRELSQNNLKRLAKIVKLQAINLTVLSTILAAPFLDQTLDSLERESRSRQLTNLDMDIDQVIEKIEEIKYKPIHSESDTALDLRERKQILNDYVTVMSLLKEATIAVKIDANGQRQTLTIYDLTEAEFQQLLKKCRDTLLSPTASLGNKHQASLVTLALSCVAMRHTTGKAPTYVQLLSLLNSINHSGNIMHEIATGGGKSINAALHAIWLWACGKTVTVTTCNNALSARDASLFKPLYAYLGIESSASIIKPDSDVTSYTKDAIHYTTGPNLALFIKKVRLCGGALPDNPAMVADEVDASLKTLVESRVATSIDPIFRDKKKWQFIYPTIMAFVNEEALFSKNECSKEDDVLNLRTYLIAKSHSQAQKNKAALFEFIQQLPDALLHQYLDSAIIANGLEENVDYMVVPLKMDKTKKGHVSQKNYHYAAPILDSTKRPDSTINWADGVQQLLHAQLNKQSKTQRFPYKFTYETHSEEIAIVSAKNFYDYFFLNNGRVIGLTATAGGMVETQEFYQQNKFTSFSHPSFHPDRCEDLPLETAPDQETQFQRLFHTLLANNRSSPGQPVLLFMESAKIAGEFYAFLSERTYQEALQDIDATIQYYDGCEKQGLAEAHFIQTIGAHGHHTITTESLARGTDATTSHPKGLFVINTCVNITQSDYRQIKGRAARNGMPGKFLCLLNEKQLALGEGESARDKYDFLQQQLESTKMKERLKLAPLNDIRHYVIENFFLALNSRANELYQSQHGLGFSFINSKGFYLALFHFNQKIEQYYKELTDQGVADDPKALRERLIAFATEEYNRYLNQAIKDEDLARFQATAPLISFDKIGELGAETDDLNIKDFVLLSQFLSGFWKKIGNQKAIALLHNLDKCLKFLIPCQNRVGNRFNFIQLLGVFLNSTQFWEPDKLGMFIDNPRLWQISERLKRIPMIGKHIPCNYVETFVYEYLQETTTAIREQNWDALAWPAIDFNAIFAWIVKTVGKESWLAKLALQTTASALSNPQGFLAKRIVLPLIKKMLRSAITNAPPDEKKQIDELLQNSNELLALFMDLVSTFNSGVHWSQIPLSSYLEKVAPFLKMPAILKLIERGIEKTPYQFISPFLPILAEMSTILTPYAHLSIRELLTTKNSLSIFVQLCQLTVVKELAEASQLSEIRQQLCQFGPAFFEQCQQIGFIPFLQLLKPLMHPRFHAFLITLPEETTFGSLKLWLASAGFFEQSEQHLRAQEVPPEVNAALEALTNYQHNQARFEQEAEAEMRAIKQQFMLTNDKIHAHLTHLAQQPMPRYCINHAPLTKEDAEPLFIAPYYIDSQAPIIPLQEDSENRAIAAIPTVEAFLTQPAVIKDHFEQIMRFAAIPTPSQDRCKPYTDWLFQALENPNLDFKSKQLLPEKIIPFIHKLAQYSDTQAPQSHCDRLKSTAISLLNDYYQRSWFISSDRRVLVRKLVNNITLSTSSVSIQQHLIDAKKTLYNDDHRSDLSFFSRLFKRFRNKKGYSRLNDRLEMLSSTASVMLLAEGKNSQYESCTAKTFSTTVDAILDQLNGWHGNLERSPRTDLTHLQRPLKDLGASINHARTLEDQQYLMNAACDMVSEAAPMNTRPSVTILIDSLTRANFIQRSATNLDYIPAISLRRCE